MSYPTSPPLMPPPGWYPDPEMAWTWRWWDGGRWTDLRAPQTAPSARDPYSFGVWFEQSVDAVKAATRRVGVLLLVVWSALGVISSVVVVTIFNSTKGREIRSLLDIDPTFGSAGSSGTIELTDAEADRLGDLATDVFWSALPWLIVLVVVGSIAATWATALVARVAEHRHDADPTQPTETTEPTVTTVTTSRTDEAGDAFRRIPVMFVSSMAVGAALIATVGICLVPLAVALALDLGGGAVAVAAVFGLLAALVVASWLWLRLSLAIVIAAIGGHGLGLRRSWALTHDHVWGVAGRLIVVGLIAGAVTAPLSIINSFAPVFGLLTYLVVVVVLQALATAVGTLIGVPAQVVLVRHLTDRHAPRLGS